MNYEFYVNINISEMSDTGLKNYDVLIGQKDWLKKRLVGFSKKNSKSVADRENIGY